MSEFTVEERRNEKGVVIKVIGCGGGGGNMINHMSDAGLNQIDLIAANTDAQALRMSKAKTTIQLGEKKTKGLGAGSMPEVGAESARESYEDIKNTLAGADMVFMATGLGGGTGTGATPIIAQAAKEIGALTVAVVTMPFKFERKKRENIAKAGLEELKKECDSIIVIYNEKLLSFLPKTVGMPEAYAMVDSVLTKAAWGMTSILLEDSRVNVDFADVRTIMSYRGLSLMGVGTGSGENAMSEAITEAVESPLFDGMSMEGAKGIVAHFKTSEECGLFQISEGCDLICEKASDDVTFTFGHTIDKDMGSNIELTIIATGFDSGLHSESKKENAEKKEKNPFLNLKKASGADYDENMINQLETPTYMRNQMD